MLQSAFDFIASLFWLALFIVLILAVVAFFGYNGLRRFSEAIREAWSNIGVVGRKQVSLVNQLIDVVKGYQESEKLVMLKVSEDTTTAASVAQMHQQAGMVLSTVSGMAQRFPELKANQQYNRLIDSIQACEQQLETARQNYNAVVKSYNIHRSSIPHVFYSSTLGFGAAPYLEFVGNDQVVDMGKLRGFSADDDGERLNRLLGVAGAKAAELGGKAIEGGRVIGGMAIEGGRVIGGKAIVGSKAIAESAQKEFKKLQDRSSAGVADSPPPPPPVEEAKYYYLDEQRKPAGPMSIGEIRDGISRASIPQNTMIVPVGATEWKTMDAWEKERP